MSNLPYDPFETIESAHEFLLLLSQAIEETKLEVDAELAQLGKGQSSRKLEALRLASFQLESLRTHIVSGQRIMNDFRCVRRLLLQEGPHAGQLDENRTAKHVRVSEREEEAERTPIAA
jgi:hypothetical protein